MSLWQRRATDWLFVLTEAVVWAMALRLLAIAFERDFLRSLAEEIEIGLRVDDFDDAGAASLVAEQLSLAAEGASHGPHPVFVVLAAFGGFYVSRALVRNGLTGSLGAVLGMIATVFGLNLLLHVVLAGNVWIWDRSGLASFIDDPSTSLTGQPDVLAFVADPDIAGPHGAALIVTFIGMIAVWGRFLLAGRSTVSYDRVIRSTGIGFVAVLLIVAAARLEGANGIANLGVPYFVLGALLLAVANAVRRLQVEGVAKRAPWVISVLLTVGGLAAIGALVGFLPLIDVDRPLVFALEQLGRVARVILVIIITPIFWVGVGIRSILSWLLPEVLAGGFVENITPAFQPEQAAEQAQEEEGGLGVPGWLPDALRILGVALLLYGAYRVVRLILDRGRGGPEDEYEEARGEAGQGAGLGSLLRNLFPRGPVAATTVNWMRRHRVYRLYGRTVVDAEERGFRRRPGETPLEFSAVAGRVLDAPLFSEIAAHFDRARYGRHYPDDEWTLSMEQRLVEWEQQHPATEELRRRVAGTEPLSEADEFALRIALGPRPPFYGL